MNIYRDGRVIELTEQEICDIYLETQRRNYVDEVALMLSEYYDIDPDEDDVDVESIALDVQSEIAENDTIYDCERETFHMVITRYLEERRM